MRDAHSGQYHVRVDTFRGGFVLFGDADGTFPRV